jgi:hypothetical protein
LEHLLHCIQQGEKHPIRHKERGGKSILWKGIALLQLTSLSSLKITHWYAVIDVESITLDNGGHLSLDIFYTARQNFIGEIAFYNYDNYVPKLMEKTNITA